MLVWLRLDHWRAILRTAAELERCPPQKVLCDTHIIWLHFNTLPQLVWFLCPTVTLTEQQHHVVTTQLPAFQSRLLSGNDGVDRWSEQAIWDNVLRNMMRHVLSVEIPYWHAGPVNRNPTACRPQKLHVRQSSPKPPFWSSKHRQTRNS